MNTKRSDNGVYVSYIKINGRPILPPVLDDDARAEMQHYRELAISVGLKIAERNAKKDAQPSKIMESSIDETLEPLEEQNELPSPTLTASTDLNQFLDSTIEVSPQPVDSTRNSGRLIRSASYTLDQPSASLLAAVRNSDKSDSRDELCCAFKEENERSEKKPSKKAVIFKKRKKVFSSKLVKKSPRTKIKRKKLEKNTKLRNDDVHIDLDLHLDLPAEFIAPCAGKFDHGYIQQEHLKYLKNLNAQENNIFHFKNILDSPTSCPKFQQHHDHFQSEIPCSVLSDTLTMISDKSPKNSNYECAESVSQNLSTPSIMDNINHNNSTTDFSRPATTQTDPVSPNNSIESLDETISPSNRSICSTSGVNLPELITNIQSEYETKLKDLLQQQEIEKQRLKDEFLRQQESLFQRLSIASPILTISTLHPPSPPIRTAKGDTPSPRRPLSAVMVSKFAHLPALVRGYLTRRLMKTERVQNIKATVRETLSLAVHLHSQPPPLHASDIALHGRLIQQLDQALIEFHDVFFTLPLPKRMALITLDRKRLQRATSSSRSRSSGSGRVSLATEKALKRRQQQQQDMLTPRTSAKSDTPLTSRQARLRNKISFQHRVSGSCSPAHTNGDVPVMTEPRANKMSERQANLTKNKRPWR